MKKMLALLIVSALASGCGTAAVKSELWEHDSIYKSWDHLKFSVSGRREMTEEEARKAIQEAWWGEETSVRVKGQ